MCAAKQRQPVFPKWDFRSFVRLISFVCFLFVRSLCCRQRTNERTDERTDERTNVCCNATFLPLLFVRSFVRSFVRLFVCCGLLWFVVCGLWFVVCGLWFVVCGLWFVAYVHGCTADCITDAGVRWVTGRCVLLVNVGWHEAG